MINKIIDFLNHAGKIAMLNYGKTHDNNYKSDNAMDIVTETDLKISSEFKNFCADNFSNLDYIIIDEESVSALGGKPFKKISEHEWQFVIDPIDGTLMYSGMIPTFAISIGILHNGQPHSGAVFAPAMDEMVYFDGTHAFWKIVNELRELIPNQNIARKQFFIGSIGHINMDKMWQVSASFGSCCISELFLATGRASGYFFTQSLWDMAGSWAILNYLGFKFFDYQTGAELKSISPESFTDDFLIRNLHIVCKPEKFEEYKKVIKQTLN